MDFVWKLGLIWFGGAVVVCVAGIGMASVAAALASWLEPKSGWQPEPTIRDKALAAWNMFTTRILR
jgi:hypothetical protein